MKWTIPAAVFMLLFAGGAIAKGCSAIDAEAADEAVDHLNSWQAVSDNFTHYGQCDDGDIAEGNSEVVIRMLVDKWKTLPELTTLAKQNAAFGEWVLGHIDSTLDSDDLQKAADLASAHCPAGNTEMCQRIMDAANQAIENSKRPPN